MPLDYCLHDMGPLIHGQLAPAPVLPAGAGEKGLAEATNSADIVVPTGGAVLACVATAKVRVDIRTVANAGLLDPANSPVVLGADVPRFFTLKKGTYKLKTSVYA